MYVASDKWVGGRKVFTNLTFKIYQLPHVKFAGLPAIRTYKLGQRGMTRQYCDEKDNSIM